MQFGNAIDCTRNEVLTFCYKIIKQIKYLVLVENWKRKAFVVVEKLCFVSKAIHIRVQCTLLHVGMLFYLLSCHQVLEYIIAKEDCSVACTQLKLYSTGNYV